MSKTGKALVIVGWLVIILIMVWVGASFIDIIADNCAPNPVHHPLNFFSILVEIGEKINS